MPQHLLAVDTRTVFEEAAQAFANVNNMENEIAEINTQLSFRTDFESSEYYEQIERVSSLSETFYSMGDINYDAEIEKILLGLGFVRVDFNRPTNEFSGGWRMRIELAKILLQKPDLILLDEPTNHLDLRTKDILKSALEAYDGTLILVSHDRDFIDGLVTKVFEFGNKRLKEHIGGIQEFIKKKKLDSLRDVERTTNK